jgi:hypothetical protein
MLLAASAAGSITARARREPQTAERRKVALCRKRDPFMDRDNIKLDWWGVPAVATRLAAIFAVGIFVLPLLGQSTAPASNPTPGSNSSAAGTPTRYMPSRFPGRAVAFYGAVWGVDSLSVKAVESGELIRFSYRIQDGNKAKLLNDKTINAFLIARAAGIRLSVPSLEKVGQLRQSSAPEAGKSYWMAFSNPGGRVKRGDHVDVVIGQFHADGLVVE